MGVYSAAGALGQFVGPVLMLGVLAWTGPSPLPQDEGGYRLLFLVLALLPLAWVAAIAISSHAESLTRRRVRRASI